MKIDIDGFDINDLSKNTLKTMHYLYDYLEKGWKLKKKHNCYIITKNKNKIYTLDNIIVNCKPVAEYCDCDCDCYNQQDNNDNHNNSKKHQYILAFLYNSLNNKWTIQKNKNNYIFIKNHEGKKEIFSDKYLHTFFEENFNFGLIK